MIDLAMHARIARHQFDVLVLLASESDDGYSDAIPPLFDATSDWYLDAAQVSAIASAAIFDLRDLDLAREIVVSFLNEIRRPNARTFVLALAVAVAYLSHLDCPAEDDS